MADDHTRHSVESDSGAAAVSRRAFVGAAGAGGVIALAGCSSNGGGNNANSSGSSGSSSSSSQGSSTGTATKKAVKIGVTLPLSGTFASLGKGFVRGLELAAQERFNGKIDGRPITFIKKDTKFKPDTAVTVTRNLIQKDDVDFVMGPVSSACAEAMKPIVAKAKSTVWVDINAASKSLIAKNCTPYMVRCCVNTYQLGHPMGKWVYDNLGKKITLGVMDYSFGHSMANMFKPAYEAAGGTVVKTVPSSPSASDYGPIVRNIANTDADVFWGVYVGSAATNFLKAAKNFGLLNKMKMTGYGLVEKVVLAAVGDADVGFPSTEYYSWQIQNQTNQNYLQTFKKKYGGLPSVNSVFAYDGMTLVNDAVTKAGSTRPDKVIPAMRGATIDSPRGNVSINPKTQDVIAPVFINKATGPKTSDIELVHTFSPVKSPNWGCDLSGTL